ncbi:MAG TPA: SDR family NAD(P)-dependent oxidoreductase [Candidatus Marinimicrobia bacterium]|nr:SDR family NAD(P)-dependent oxidoreductase [Candidatus Neomarinimicrobiota bacterium]|tara:strand:- start:1238 stop:2071 length:834 start_codon:yes stop_codon:yes gene_type:complete
MNLKNKIVLVTGAAKGIGLATVKRLLKKEAKVILWDFQSDDLNTAVQSLKNEGHDVFSQVCDVTNKEQVYHNAEVIKKEIGDIDILINNAGTVYTGYMLDRSDAELENMINVNFTSMIYTIRAFMPAMLEKNKGHIVNISSASSLIGAPKLAIYAATKWAVMGLTESLRMEAIKMGKKGVKFSSVHPNFLKKGLFEGTKLNLLGSIFAPGVKSHDAVAKVIVNKAIRWGFHSPKVPWIMNQSVLLRALLPSSLLIKFGNIYGVNNMMDEYTGYKDGR